MARKVHTGLRTAMVIAGLALSIGLGWLAFRHSGEKLPPKQGAENPPPVPTIAVSPAPSGITAAPKPPPPLPPPPPPRGRVMDVSTNPDFDGLTPTLINYSVELAPPEVAMQALYGALQIPLPARGRASTFLGNMPPTTLLLERTPLLDVILQFSTKTGARLRTLSSGLLEFTYPAGTPDETPVGLWCLAGPFAVTLDRIETSVYFPPAGAPSFGYFITMSSLAEPSAPVAGYPRNFRIEKFVDDTGRDLTFGSVDNPAGNRSPSSLRVPISLPPDRGKKIALLKGSAPFLLLQEFTPLEVALPLTEAKTVMVNGLKVELRAISGRGRGSPSLSARFTRGDLPPDRWEFLSAALSSLQVDAFGGAILTQSPSIGPAPLPADDGSVAINLFFNRTSTNQPEADRAILKIPRQIRTVNVPFEFRDIYLP